MQWRTILGLSAKQAAVDYAVEKGWIIVEEGCSVRVTDEGCSLVRRGMLRAPPTPTYPEDQFDSKGASNGFGSVRADRGRLLALRRRALVFAELSLHDGPAD